MHPGDDTRRTLSSKRRNRRRYQQALLETLEQRQLLSGTYSGADMNASWSFNGLGGVGEIQFDANNLIVSASILDESGATLTPVGNYTISASGDVVIIADGLTFTGAMNATRDAIMLSQQGTGEGDFSNSQTLLIRNDLSGLTNADLNGVWSLFVTGNEADSTGQGTLTFDGAGHITGGSVTDAGGVTTVSGGSYAVTSDGEVTATIITSGTAGGTLTFAGQLNASKDILSQSPIDFPAAASDNASRLLVMIRSAGTYSKADLNGSWDFNGDGLGGNVIFNGNGTITGGSGVDESNTPITFTGTYTVSSAGKLTINLVVHNGTNPTFTVVERGVLSASKNFAATEPTPSLTVGADSADSLILFTSGANHTPTLTTVNPFQTAIEDTAFVFTYADLLAKTNAADLDGDTLSFVITSLGSGTLKINGNPANVSDTIEPGDNLSWKPALGAKGNVTAFSVKAGDGDATSSKAVPVVFKTVLIPTITIAATRANASEINGTGSGMGLLTLTRANGILSDVLDVTITVTGTALNGTDYSTIATEVHFSANKNTATIPINVLTDAFAEGKETVIVTVVGTSTDEIYQIGTKSAGTVTIADAASTITAKASKPKASEVNGTSSGMGQFTLTRTGGNLNVSQTVKFNISGTAGSSNFNIPSGGAIVYNATAGTGTITFAPGKNTAVIPFFPINDDLADTPALSSSLTVVSDAATASYFIGTPAAATVAIADAAPTVSVTAKSALKISNGSVSRLGEFVVLRKGLDLTTTQTVVFELSGSAVDLDNFTVVNSSSVTFDTLSNTGTLTLSPGQKSGIVTVNPINQAAANATADAMIFTLVADGGPSYFIDPLLSAAAGDLTSTYSATVTKAKASEVNGSTSGMGQFTVTRKGGDLSRAVTVDFALGGTVTGFGVPEINYHILTSSNVTFNASTGTGTIVFAAGKTSVNIPFTSIDDQSINPPASQGGPKVHLVVNQDDEHTFLVDPAKDTADIIIADAASVVGVKVTKNATEINGTSSGMGAFTFTRTGGNLKAPLTVTFNLAGTAVEGTDYVTVSPHSVTFPANKTTAVLNIKAIDDVDVEANQIVELVLQTDTTYFLDLPNSVAEMSITDDTRPVIFGPLSVIPGATVNTPLTISYNDLVTATNAQVPAGGTLTFKITKVLKGTLQKNSVNVVPNTTTLATGESLTWMTTSAGTIKAFNVVALNGTNASASITVAIQAT